ncbi:MAG: lipopolysaccharide heptosyltransferase family protein [Proteobacteria bacterium]|nr:MAG: lipopolysaccharide heptosyltransferase family protein [Pseudomonadota bacterium]
MVRRTLVTYNRRQVLWKPSLPAALTYLLVLDFSFGSHMKKVLLVCFDNLGDLVFASALARSLSSDPTIQLSLLCKDYTAKLGYLLPGIEQVFAADPFWDRAPNRKKGKFANFLKCLFTVRDQKFDEAYIVGSNWQSALAMRFSGIKKVYALRGRKNRWLVSSALPQPSRTEPVVKGLLKSFGPLLPKEVAAETFLNPKSFPHYERPGILRDKKLVVLHAFAGRADRCAPLSLWGELARALHKEGYHVLWTGIPVETMKVRQAFPQEWDGSHFVDTWAQDLLQLAWIWSESKLFVGHDSGPLHVANALGVPVLGLYLPGEPKRTFPQGHAPSLMIHKTSPSELSVTEVISSSLNLLGKAN